MCDIYGNYMGYMDFNGVRYFDVREVREVWNPIKSIGSSSLQSDCTKRLDGVILRTGDVESAQEAKE